MYIGERDNRGVAICPKISKFGNFQDAPEELATTKYQPTTQKHSANVALVIAYVLAAVLIASAALATGIRYFLKKTRCITIVELRV